MALQIHRDKSSFDEPVDVTGKPQLEVTIGSATQYADYASGSGSKSLAFKYTVTEGEVANGVAAKALDLNLGTIKIKRVMTLLWCLTQPIKFSGKRDSGWQITSHYINRRNT